MCFLFFIFLAPQMGHELTIPGLGCVCFLLKYIGRKTLYKLKVYHMLI